MCPAMSLANNGFGLKPNQHTKLNLPKSQISADTTLVFNTELGYTRYKT